MRPAPGPGPPSVSVVVATRDRPDLVRRALAGIRGQDYDGAVDCIVVFDRTEPDVDLATDDGAVRVVTNTRSPGLAGARNTGLEQATGDLVAFCDDDDEWRPAKLRAQVAALTANPSARAATCGIEIRHRGRSSVRIPVAERLTFDGFLADRMTEVHPSTFLLEREWLRREVGLVDEALPGSYAEDYDLLLRVSRMTAIAVADQPLAVIWWHPKSFFAERWQTINDALGHLTEKFPEFARSPRGLARIRGQQAVALAALGDRRGVWRAAREALRLRATERRAYLALTIATGLLSAERALRIAHRFGRGI